MTGNASISLRTPAGLLARLKQRPCRYIALDGGSGAHLFAALDGRDAFVQQVNSPRHADLLIITEPINQKLAPAVVELARSLPRPARALLVSTSGTEADYFTGAMQADVRALLPGIQRTTPTSIEALLDSISGFERWPELESIAPGEDEPTLLSLPQKQEQELATELVVLSLGPVQSFTAGPLRLLLICDGEQILSAQVESGYARRDIAQAMTRLDWQQGIALARCLDPLAPVACQLVYVSALEHLQGWQPGEQTIRYREIALALERAQNMLWWLVRFLRLLVARQLAEHAYQLATALTECISRLWQSVPSTWIRPQQHVESTVVHKKTEIQVQLQAIGAGIETLFRTVEHDRLIALRTRGIGVLTPERLVAAGVSGPTVAASERGAGDVRARLLARLRAAASDVQETIRLLSAEEGASTALIGEDVPAGHTGEEARAEVKGPRGTLGVHLVSDGEGKPAQVEWQRPSAALLPLLPELLAGEILADAEVILASLDLAIAEADG